MNSEYLNKRTDSLTSEGENLCMSLPLESKHEDSLNSSQLDKQETTDHTLDEFTFDIDLEKSCLESYFYRKENENKRLKVKNYSITNADYCKNLINRIEKEVIYNSESTSEAKLINLQEELSYIIKEKQNTNSFINENPEMATENYLKILMEIDKIFLTIQDNLINDPVVDLIRNEKKLIMSNLSIAYTKKAKWKESIQIDEEIIKLDEKFIKPYARLIKSNVILENFQQAKDYAEKLRTRFNRKEISQFDNILEDFDKKYQENEDRASKKFSRNFKKNLENEDAKIKKEEPVVTTVENTSPQTSKVPEIEKKSQVAKKHQSWLSILFGGFIFVSSSAGLFFLYKYRKNFSL